MIQKFRTMDKKCCIVFFLLIGINWIGINSIGVQGMKVSQRFGGSAPKDCNCIMQIMAMNHMFEAAAVIWADFKKISGFDKAKYVINYEI